MELFCHFIKGKNGSKYSLGTGQRERGDTGLIALSQETKIRRKTKLPWRKQGNVKCNAFSQGPFNNMETPMKTLKDFFWTFSELEQLIN